MNPFKAISGVCVLLPDVGPIYILSIRDASLLGNVGIGAIDQSGRGTCRCDGAISPDGRVNGAIDSGKAQTVCNFARPQSYQ